MSEEIENDDEVRQESMDWQQKAEENWDRYLRTQADFDNYRRRVERDMDQSLRRGKRHLILGVLGVLDNFERALAAEGGPDALRKGVEIILRQLKDVLAAEGVTALETVGQPFDPAYHEALDVWESPDAEEERISDELQKGYTYQGELLRPARVRVVRPAQSAVEAEDSPES